MVHIENRKRLHFGVMKRAARSVALVIVYIVSSGLWSGGSLAQRTRTEFNSPVRQEAQRTWPGDQVVFTGPLSSDDLATIIKGATLSVIPSLYEGFCLPLVESMACGVPTIASNSSCIPEISGGALQYFDAYSIEEMAERIHHALSDTDLRRELRTRGLERASVFSWRRCAEETLRVLAKAA